MSLIRPGCGIHVVWSGTDGSGVTDVRFAYPGVGAAPTSSTALCSYDMDATSTTVRTGGTGVTVLVFAHAAQALQHGRGIHVLRAGTHDAGVTGVSSALAWPPPQPASRPGLRVLLPVVYSGLAWRPPREHVTKSGLPGVIPRWSGPRAAGSGSGPAAGTRASGRCRARRRSGTGSCCRRTGAAGSSSRAAAAARAAA